MNIQDGAPKPRAKGLLSLADQPLFLMLVPGLFWAGNAILARGLAGEVPPVGLAFWRWTLAAILILPLAWRYLGRDLAVMARSWPIMLVLSALGISVYNTFLYFGAQTTTAINLVMLQTLMPVLVVIGTFLVFREMVTPRQGAGIIASLAGALTLISHGDPAVLAHLDFKTGDLWMLAAVVCYAAYTVLLRLRPVVHGFSFAFATFALGATLLLPFYLAETHGGWPMPLTLHAAFAVGYVSVLASILAYLAFNRVVELVGANTAGLAVHLVPVFGTILAVLLLGESLHPYHGMGIALIATGIWLATRKPAAS
ncbi:DMT family transporter [Hyphomicrobium sp.]|uniref:DMT family transporter n=1 Tax=Hyphomicrobium sp. TaxID=82 RepID=UPI002E3196B8|nr:DMT family transporter [Hyphomicrobium sp.]HEX2840330.1 DMT family transporter [Hyphomicrobium sp.]